MTSKNDFETTTLNFKKTSEKWKPETPPDKMPTKIKNVANALNAYETSFDCTQISHVKQKSPALARYEVSKRLMDENIDFRTRGER